MLSVMLINLLVLEILETHKIHIYANEVNSSITFSLLLSLKLNLGKKKKKKNLPYAKLSYRENWLSNDNQFLLRFDISDNTSQLDSLQTRIVGCVDKI